MTSGEITNTIIKQAIFIPSQGKWKINVSHTNGTNYGFKISGTGSENDTLLSDRIYNYLLTVTLETLPSAGTSITRNITLIDNTPRQDR